MFTITLPGFFAGLAFIAWVMANVRYCHEEGEWHVDIDDALFLILLAIYAALTG